MDRISVLFDTDIGSNIDDALALAYLLRQQHCNLLGITTVSGPVERRAACAAAVCRAAGRAEVPIHCGASAPLLFGPGQPDVPHYFALAESERVAVAPTPSAVEFMRSSIRASRDPVVLLSTGPLTNIALLFATDPEIPSMLRAFVSMAGVFGPHERRMETNCRVDPTAAAAVYRLWEHAPSRGGPRVRPNVSVGLDVTTRCSLSADEYRKWLGTVPGFEVIARMSAPLLRDRHAVTFNDPLAAAVIFRPTLCGYASGTVQVSAVPGSADAGTTHFAPSPTGPHRITTTVNPAVFFREFFSVFE